LFLMFTGPVLRSVANQQYIFVSTRLAVRLQSALTQQLYHRAMTCMELEEDILNDMMSQGKGKAKVKRGWNGKAKGKERGDKQKLASKSTSSGRLANLMAADVAALHRARDCIMVFLGLPVGVTLAFILLYQIIGWTAFAGVACLFLPLPIVAGLTRAMNMAQRAVKHAQDSRISLISEYLGSIKAIKCE
jgi:ABC-type multidrug transport system fused ATPase/permease subunit